MIVDARTGGSPTRQVANLSYDAGLPQGRVTLWISPSRNPGETLPLRTAVRMFWLPGIAALGMTALAWWLVPRFLIYLLAVIVGWVIAIPMARGSSRPLKTASLWSDRMPVYDYDRSLRG